MNRKGIRAKDMFRFLSVGRFYWRLAILPLIGAILLYGSYVLTHGEEVLPISFPATFLTSYFTTIWFIGTTLRDRTISIMPLLQLLPINKTKKQCWLYLRSAWLPGLLLLLGAMITPEFGHIFRLEWLLLFLPYMIAVVILLGILHWKGSFVVVDTETFLGSLTSRDQTILSLITFTLGVSPIIYDFFSVPLKVITTAFLFIVAFVYGRSSLHAFQIDGDWMKNNKDEKVRKKRGFSFINKRKSSSVRYFYYLEWSVIQRPLLFYLLNFGIVLFVVLIYYALGGLFSFQNDVSIFERGLIVSLLVTYSTFLIHHPILPSFALDETDMLLPLNQRKKSIVHTMNQIFRPSVYTILNSIAITVLIIFIHLGLSLIIQQPQLSQGKFLWNVFSGVWITIVFSIMLYSLLDFLLLSMMVFMQTLRRFKLSLLIYHASLFFYVTPLFLISFLHQEKILSMDTYIDYSAIPMYVAIFILARIGLHFVLKKVQVISR
ncbi:hypothetical protein J2T56_003233 [Natronobacillus azotifigens]|uniref:Uncharacterized protein n=1 Tax=Natronobacillus azotifigens TaxID=472978 RepID=A0A9J6RGD2_9BACI|nr:hypothetical protein [Natronobacillus azotifigens]MCZ0704631.1 hypothetical protein [Natronobacillus azotifigens]